MNELALFAGAGGGILGGKLLGWKTVCAVEFNSFCCRRLMQHQNEGHLPPFPIWDDVRTFDGTPWRGIVDVVSGGFPCQDISSAGKGAGLDGERSGLWSEMARIICEIQPRFVLVENSPMLTSRGLGRVLGDLAEMGFDARWGVMGGHHVGAAHYRERIWILANAQGERGNAWDLLEARQGGKSQKPDRRLLGLVKPQQWRPSSLGAHSECGIPGLADGVAESVDRLTASGNGQIPAVVKAAWEILSAEAA